ncbi:MAG TPA: DUF3267 domain-containing protein [Anaerolineae bacterium]|nr:DUF3267 domain-containing protein [Anaerolineae bacterium]HQH39466.1 DUF3267 domain-containing protein [Anaerolineae bacterium]
MSIPPVNVPDAYQEVLYWKLSHHHKLLVTLNVAGLVLMLVMGGVFMAWARLWQSPALHHTLHSGLMAVLVVLAVALVLVLHEFVHGLALKAYGARPQYGVMWQQMMFYATAPNYAFRRNAYLVIALAPLVGISILGGALLMLPLPGWLLRLIALCAAVNVGGAVGDMWLVRVALKYPACAYIVDEQDGMRVFMPDENTRSVPEPTTQRRE